MFTPGISQPRQLLELGGETLVAPQVLEVEILKCDGPRQAEWLEGLGPGLVFSSHLSPTAGRASWYLPQLPSFSSWWMMTSGPTFLLMIRKVCFLPRAVWWLALRHIRPYFLATIASSFRSS